MKKLVLKLLLLLPIAGFVVGLNYYVDPAHRFNADEYARGIGYALAEGYNVADAGNHDDRLVQRYFAEKSTLRPDILVLGSSRSMYIRAEFFPGHTLFNSFVAPGTVEDYVAIYQLYRQREKIPKWVIIGIDPWLLDDNHHFNKLRHWEAIKAEYWALASSWGTTPVEVASHLGEALQRKAATLFSISYFQEAFKYFVQNKRNQFYRTTSVPQLHAVRFSDGSALLDLNGRNMLAFAVKAKAQNQVKNQKPFAISDTRSRQFEAFLSALLKDGVRPIFFLSPYHPIAVGVERIRKNLEEIQSYFEILAGDKGIPVIGSFDPASSSLPPDDFEDISHLRSAGIQKVFLASGNGLGT